MRPAAALALLTALAGCSQPDWGTYGPELDALTPAQWTEDVRTLVRELESRHPDPWHASQEAEFHAAADALVAALPTLDADGAVLGIQQLLVRIGEGHTQLNASPSERFFLGLRWFPEGLYVTAIESENEALLGGRVVSLGGVSATDASARVRPAIAADRRDDAVLQPLEAGVYMNPRFMRALRLATPAGLVVTVEKDGTERTATLLPRASAEFRYVVDTVPTPLSRSGQGAWWTATDPDTGALFVRYGRCDAEGTAVLDEALAKVTAGEVPRLVFDLRRNGGGNSLPGRAFAERLKGTSVDRAGGIVVLIGPETFSSAVMNALDFKTFTHARFAGEALPQSAKHYGEVSRFVLPNSQLVVGVSTRLWDYLDGTGVDVGTDGVLRPDPGLAHVTTWAEYVAGRDPVLELALAQ